MSGHAQYAVVPEAGAIVVPVEMPFDVACLLGCGVMTGVGAATRIAEDVPGSTTVVFGCGAVGLNAVQGARLAGAANIIAVDPSPSRRELALRLGATQSIDPSSIDAVDAIRQATNGRGADICIEAAGLESVMRHAIQSTRPAGQVILLGKLSPGSTLDLPFADLMGEKRVSRSSYGGARPSRDFPWLASLYLKGDLILDELITTRLDLSSIDEGFDAMRDGSVVRAVLMPNA